MFARDQRPAGQAKGKTCAVLVPIQQSGAFQCQRCGTFRDEPTEHIALMSIMCPAGAGEFVESSKVPPEPWRTARKAVP